MVRYNRIPWVGGLISLFIMGCVSGTIRQVHVSTELPEDLPKDLKDRFEVKEAPIGQASPSPLPSHEAESSSGKIELSTHSSKHKKKNRKISAKAKVTEKVPSRAESPLPFEYPSRRPAKEPIWISERFVYSVSYFAMSAGDFTFEVLPFKEIDHRKVYHVRGNVVSSAVFSLFYRLNDVVESFIDYEGLFSHRFHLVLDETKQTRDSLELYDSQKKQTYYWNRWNHKVNGYKEVKELNSVPPFAQDSLSSIYYLRAQKLEPGMVVSFPVVSEGKSFEAICTVLRREQVDSPFGSVQALVIRPEMKVDGVIKKPHGDSFLWLTDDDRKIPLRLEAKVRIGTVVGTLKKFELGTSPESPAQRSVGTDSDVQPNK